MTLKFYYAPRSSATRVHWALEELGISYEKIKLDLNARDQHSFDFLKVNPNGKIPAIVDDGVPMFESLAILIYLGDKYGPSKQLWPAPGTPDRMHALTWTVWGTVTFAASISSWTATTLEGSPRNEHSSKRTAEAREAVEGCLRILNDQLVGKDYLLGADFSLVDVANATFVGFAARNGIDPSCFPSLSAWFTRSTERPGRTVAKAG